MFWGRRLEKGRQLFRETKVHPRQNPVYAYVYQDQVYSIASLASPVRYEYSVVSFCFRHRAKESRTRTVKTGCRWRSTTHPQCRDVTFSSRDWRRTLSTSWSRELRMASDGPITAKCLSSAPLPVSRVQGYIIHVHVQEYSLLCNNTRRAKKLRILMLSIDWLIDSWKLYGLTYDDRVVFCTRITNALKRELNKVRSFVYWRKCQLPMSCEAKVLSMNTDGVQRKFTTKFRESNDQ